MTISEILIVVRQKLKDIANSESLRHRAIRASGWTVGGHLANQFLRLAANLVLTRLLFPEVFGLMVIVQSLMTGVVMFSDLGIEASVIQNKRGDEDAFVNTAWTMKVIQGVLIWVVLCVLAQFASVFYAQPLLSTLGPAVGLGAVIGGFASTKLALSNRTLDMKQRVLIELGSYTIGLLVTIIWAWIDHSIWSLVWGGLLGTLLKTMASHVMLKGAHNRFVLEKDSVKALFGFGQWVLVSSTLTFFVGEGNKLLLGAFLGVQLLAFFNLASTMNAMFWQIFQQLSNKVLFPAYSELARNQPERLRAVVAKSRLVLIVPAWGVGLLFLLWGDHFMWMLYDQRYAEAGNIIRMLAIASLMGAISGSYNGLLMAKGMVRTSAVILAVQMAIQIIGMVVGYYLLGYKGVILSAAVANWLLYPFQAYVYATIDLWDPKIDFPFIAITILAVWLNFSDIYSHV